MLTNRSKEKELLDLGTDYYTPEEYVHCHKMLFRVNKFFGFFNSTLRLLKKFPEETSLLDVGCGGGLFLLHLSKYFSKMQLQGIDISPAAIEMAKQELKLWQTSNNTFNNISFALHTNKYFDFPKNNIDIILTTMMCHHLDDNEIIDFLTRASSTASRAVIINDLHRHFIPHFFYRLISPILFKNRLITHDGLISIRRGFTYLDWQKLLLQAKISNYQINWCFPFRWQVIIWKK